MVEGGGEDNNSCCRRITTLLDIILGFVTKAAAIITGDFHLMILLIYLAHVFIS